MHIPVLLQEVVNFLEPKSGEKYIDATYGGGGHSSAIVEKGGIVLGIDADPSAPGVTIGNFKDIKQIAEENGFTEVDGILFDLGMGSHQLDDPERGFSFQKTGPLDMRYDPSGKFQTAADIVNKYGEKELVRLFYNYGEERRFGKKIAQAILARRKVGTIRTTTELFELIKHALPGKFRFKAAAAARRIFQSLRIEVNQELQNLEKALPQAVGLLKGSNGGKGSKGGGPASTRGGEPTRGGRLAVISFHSLEDRIVKTFFARLARDCVCPPDFPICRCDARASLRILTKKPVTASEEEIKTNPRSKSAKMRVAEKII